MVPKKNFKYLILPILVLVLTIGLSVSFFVSYINKDSNTTSTTSNIVELEDTKFLIEGNLSINDLNIYPGHKNISSIKITATGDQEVNYDLVWNGTNEISNINYTVYKTTELVETTSNCIRKTEENNSTTKYYEECNITNLVNLGEVISNGTITSSNLEQNITLKANESIQASKEGTVLYYYVILEFPNLNEEQNIDMNKKFDGIVTVESAQLGNKKEKGDLNILALYQNDGNGEYQEIEEMPNSNNYIINEEKSYCNVNGQKDNSVVFKTDETGKHNFTGLKKGSNCYIYFDKDTSPLIVNKILAKYIKNNSRSEDITAGFKESTPTTVYSKEDDYGTSYFFAGVNPNNWVKMGNIYYRIIRFNGNGSMRLIYSGSGSAQTSGTGTQIGTKAFNVNYNDNMYVGLQYTSGQVHGNTTNSTILGEENTSDATTLYGWYNSNIKNMYGNLIDSNAGFCSDRENYTDNTGTTSGGGTGTTLTSYGAYIRYLKGGTWRASYTPTLKCKNSSDLLKLPIGLITADEYALAGGGSYEALSYYNTTFWLHTGLNYLTMTPADMYTNGNIHVFRAHSSGYLMTNHVGLAYGVRPVINLKSTTKFVNNGTGSPGSSTNPYEVVLN